MSKTTKAVNGLKKVGHYVAAPFKWGWHNKKKTALVLGAGAAAAGGAMYAGVIPTPDIVVNATQLAVSTAQAHPEAAMIGGGAVGGIVGWAALKKGAKGTKIVYKTVRNAKTIAKDAATKATSLLGNKKPASGGVATSPAAQEAIDWDKTKFFVAET